MSRETDRSGPPPSPWLLLDSAEIRSEVERLRTEGPRAAGSVWVLLAGAIAFSAVNVALFAIKHGTPPQTAWALDLLFAVGLVVVIQASAVLARHRRGAGGWVATVRVYCGAATLALNIWEPVAKHDFAAVLVHIVAPGLLILFAEAVPRISQHYAALIEELLGELRRREQAERATAQQVDDQRRADRRRVEERAATERDRQRRVEEEATQRRDQIAMDERRLDAETERARVAAEAAGRQADAERARLQLEAARLAAAAAGALGGAPKSTPKSTRKSTPAGSPGSANDDLMKSARAFWAEHLKSTGEPPSQRRLKAALGVGFERAAEIQRVLAAEFSPAGPTSAEAGRGV